MEENIRVDRIGVKYHIIEKIKLSLISVDQFQHRNLRGKILHYIFRVSQNYMRMEYLSFRGISKNDKQAPRHCGI